VESSPSADTEISLAPERVAEMLEAGQIQLIDVRHSSEWESGHVAGSRHIEIEQVPAQAETIDRGRPVVFACRGGSRSEMVASAFRQSGWEAYNMDGGLRAWAERGLQLEPEGGRVLESRRLPGG
jgi:rhodanese-related sulfurtransferase